MGHPGVLVVLLVEGDGEGLALVVGFAGEVEDAEGAVGVFGGDGERGFAEEGVADVGVELAVVAGDGGDGGADELRGLREVGADGEGAPGGFVFSTPASKLAGGPGFGEPRFSTPASKLAGGPGLGGVERGWAEVGVGEEDGLLRVDAELAEAAVGAVDEEAWGGFGGEHGGVAGVAEGAAAGHVVVEDEV